MMKALVPMLGLLSAMALAQTTDSSAIAGDWNGTLDTGAHRLRIAVHVARAPDGALSAKFDSLDQGALGIAVDAVRFDAGLFSFQMARLTASFSGRLSPDGQRIEGTFQQGPG